MPLVGVFAAIGRDAFFDVLVGQLDRLDQDRLHLRALALHRAHHDVPAQLEVIARRPGLDGRAHVFRVLAPVAQRTDFAADRDGNHLATRLLERTQPAQLGRRLDHDAVQLARIRGQPLLHFGLRDLIGPHARHTAHHLDAGILGQRSLHTAVLGVGRRRAGNALDHEHVALLADLFSHPGAELKTAELEVGRRIDRIGRGQVARRRKDRNALVVRHLDRLVQGGRVRAADDDRVDALIDELAHLLDLRRVFQIRLGDDHFLDQTELLPLGNQLVLQPVHHRSAPGVACVGTCIADGPRRPLLGLPVAVRARAQRLRRVHHVFGVEVGANLGREFVDAGGESRARQSCHQAGQRQQPEIETFFHACSLDFSEQSRLARHSCYGRGCGEARRERTCCCARLPSLRISLNRDLQPLRALCNLARCSGKDGHQAISILRTPSSVFAEALGVKRRHLGANP